MTTPQKFDGEKNRYDLIPATPLDELARVYTIGAAKYGDRNWEGGLKWGRIFAAMMRHAWAYWRGERTDPVDGQHHLASVAWCAFALMEYETTHPELDDRTRAAEPKTVEEKERAALAAHEYTSRPRDKWTIRDAIQEIDRRS